MLDQLPTVRRTAAPPFADCSEELPRLRRVHERLIAAIDVKEELLAAPSPAITHCSLVRWNVARARHERRRLISELLQGLVRKATPREAELLRQLQESEIEFARHCTSHTQTWTLQNMTELWDEYAREGLKHCAVLRERIAFDMQLLYPLLLAETAPPAVSTRAACARTAVS